MYKITLCRKAIRYSTNLRLSRFCSTSNTKSITGYENADRALRTVTGGRVNQWVDAYEDFIGLTEVREAQTLVKKAEEDYKLVQEERRTTQQQLNAVQARLKKITTELEKTRRGEDAYIELITKENEIIKEEKRFMEELQRLEEMETSSLGIFSSALRESHEKERARAERMKYLSIIGSVVGACIGIIGAAISNYRRMRELRGMVTSSADISKTYGEQILEVSKAVSEQYDKVQASLNELRTEIGLKTEHQSQATHAKVSTGAETTTAKLNELLQVLKKQESMFEHELNDIRKALATRPAGDINQDNVVYIGPELQSLLEGTERNLGRKIETQTTRTVMVLSSIAVVALIVAQWFNPGGR